MSAAQLRPPHVRQPWRMRATVALVAASLAGQATAQSFIESLRNVGNAIQAATGASGPTPPVPQAPQQPSQPLTGQRPNTGNAALDRALGPAQGAPMSARMAALFQKGTVNGADLFDTLKAIRLETQAQRTAAAWAKANVAMDLTVAQIDAGGMPKLESLFNDIAFKFMEEQLKSMVATVSMQALDGFLATLMDDSAGLAAETVTLPAAQPGMTEAQAKRIVNMAAMIVAARMTSKALDQANKNLSQLQTDYAAIIQQREDMAAVLFELIEKRRQAQRSRDDAALAQAEATLKASLTVDEMNLIDNQLLSLKLSEFAKHMDAQNQAIEVAKRLNPEAYKNYRARADDVVARTRAYMKTVTGVAAFGGLMLNFSQQMVAVGREKNVPNLLQAMPLGIEFVRAAFPAAELAVKSTLNGFVLQPANTLLGGLFGGTKANWVVTRGDKREELKDAAAVFKWIEQQGMKPQFSGALFRNDTPGWLGGVLKCDAMVTGSMLDAAVPPEQRDGFAKTYLRYSVAEGFSFMNALTQTPRTDRESELATEVIGRDHRQSVRSADPALIDVQVAVSEKYGNWNDPQLMRIVFGNRGDQAASRATLEIGQLTIRPVPSADSVYAYEGLAESCRQEKLNSAQRERAAGAVAARRQVNDGAAGAAAQPAAVATNPTPGQPEKKRSGTNEGNRKPAAGAANNKQAAKPAGATK